MIELTLPYPISANRYWRSFLPRGARRPVVTLSEAAHAYKAGVALLVIQAGVLHPIPGRVAVEIELYPHRPNDWEKRAKKEPDSWDDGVMCLDLDNANKVIFDSLKGLTFADDKWVREIHSRRMKPDGVGRVVIRITELAHYRSDDARDS